MTVEELRNLLRDADPTDIVTIAIYQRHGDTDYYKAFDVIDRAIVTFDDENYNAIVIGTDNYEEVSPVSMDYADTEQE